MEERDREELFSKRIRAGKRTYFFDVKSTRSNDYYITITESRRYQKDDGFGYEKHKMFLYKEDFEKFVDGLNEVVSYIKANSPAITEAATSTATNTEHTTNGHATNGNGSFSDVSFEDLGNK